MPAVERVFVDRTVQHKKEDEILKFGFILVEGKLKGILAIVDSHGKGDAFFLLNGVNSCFSKGLNSCTNFLKTEFSARVFHRGQISNLCQIHKDT